jgi:methylaspartate mutase sigma subunit
MGFFDCEGLREKCIEAGLKDILLYIGGQLGTNREEWNEVEKRFKGIGFDRVYSPATRPKQLIVDLTGDLKES